MKKLKSLLLSVLGENRYLGLVASSFQRLFKTGALGSEYQDIYFLKNHIRQGDHCVDIGAHLGYYTLELSRLAGGSGKITAIEPVSKFYTILDRLISRSPNRNTRILKIALGGSGEQVEIGIPRIDNQKKFGYARIRQLSEYMEYAESEMVNNVNGDKLFDQETRIDFIKCDVEGAEVAVFSSMHLTLEKHRPVLLCELADKNERIKLFEMLNQLAYQVYILREGKLHRIDVYGDEKPISHNHYYIPFARLERFEGMIVGK